MPNARNEASLIIPPTQQSASFPSTTTAGTLDTPNDFARSATLISFILSTNISQDEQATLLTSLTASSHIEQPALNTSTFLLTILVS